MTDQDVPEVMQGRVLEYYQYLWARSKGQQMQELFADAPYCLQSELFLTITYDMLNNVRTTCARCCALYADTFTSGVERVSDIAYD